MLSAEKHIKLYEVIRLNTTEFTQQAVRGAAEWATKQLGFKLLIQPETPPDSSTSSQTARHQDTAPLSP